MSELENEEDNAGVSLEVITDFNFIDGVTVQDNGPEQAVEAQYDLSNLIDDAQIRQRLADLLNETTVDIQDIVDNFLIGDFESFNATTGILVVAGGDVASLRLDATLFFQSNIDFTIPVRLIVEDRATINGMDVVETEEYNATLQVDLVGQADPPTVFADDANGTSLTPIPVNLGGEITDTDIALGRNASETIYYIVSEVANYSMPFDYRVSPEIWMLAHTTFCPFSFDKLTPSLLSQFINTLTNETVGNDRGIAWYVQASEGAFFD